MVKIHTTLSIEDEIIQKAKNMGINISAFLENELRNKTIGINKKDLPEHAKVIKCMICAQEINEGYFCRESQKVFCLTCGKNWDMPKNCGAYYQIIDGMKIHEHIRFPGFGLKNQEIIPEVEKASSNGT